jgi:uncharacterized repeat protein (TIGR03803 family)
LIQAREGNLYGTTWSGGPGNNGTIFKVDSSGSVTTFHASAGTDGTSFFASLVESSDGNLYGTTYYGGGADDAVTGGNGTVFKIDASGILTTLHSFAGADGSNPHARLTRGADGQLYGTTYLGGNAGNGTVFKMDSSGAVTTLHSFSGSGGATPYAALVGRGDGNFLGTTYFGGTAGKGTVFTLTPSGGVITLHSFAGSDGANPCAALVHGSDGNFYGTTYLGGATNNGAVFRIDSSGAVTTLHSFAGPPLDGAKPFAGLVQGSDGNFYGTTVYGGADDQGTVFKMDSSGAVTTLHSFPGLVYLGLPLDGQYPYAGLIQASDGKFYGTTYKGGVSNAGVIFSVDSSGSTTTLHSFAGSDGANPSAGLIQGNDGNFYGTTWSGGAANRGTLFKMDFSGAVTTLHSFTGSPSDGAYPFAGLVQGTDGSFYGMTQFVGSSNSGTVFKIDASAVVTTLHVFEGAAHPFGGLIQSSDGNFYGATSSDAKGIGTVFRIKIATPVQLVSAASRKIHGSVRTFDIRLPLTGNGAVECRSGGMNGNHTLVFTFANALTNVDGANVTSGTGSISSSNIDLDDPHDYIVNLSGVENAQTISVSLTNVTDSIGEFSASVPVSLRVLVGDTNGDGFVNSADISQTKSQSGQAVSASNFREDVTMDGNLNSADISLVKSKSGTGLP